MINWKVLKKALIETAKELSVQILEVIINVTIFFGPLAIVVITGKCGFIFLYILSIYLYQVIGAYYRNLDD